MVNWVEIYGGYPLDIVSIADDKTKVFPKRVEFKPGMNILFGPNGCGKSTIVKTIGANAMTVRGWSNMNYGPMKVAGFSGDKMDIRKHIEKTLGFPSAMDFDGPVYYHNDYDLERYACYTLYGTGVGTGVACAEAYLAERMDNRMRSSGEAEMAIQGNTLVNILDGRWKFNRDAVIKAGEEKREDWGQLLEAQREYADRTWLRGGAPTLLMDEPELHLSFETMDGLFTRFIPKFLEQGYQVIIATHYPFAPFQFPDANIIGIDRDVEAYKERVRTLINNTEKNNASKHTQQ